ncbi:AGL129Wp [Eremothecium gossypii ATCC 10895]|uniref:AGL129Wp n=1 Tax=Eremothecium gossypii (strain ATCC 10895 / CBS 109.51 / FGSC 9923 / NRRL Y-1056) TaxID=284811 RepID=Q750R8_EREGS|nr:AGL129Wp [Eremothecium gossypii ATCC 10895]AAS54362.1 AGL129Wp [Eremothecium gossypii ATCC 10895]AEY98689.1 FAGL129Wp [Eremothecium gossypii FDAG1]
MAAERVAQSEDKLTASGSDDEALDELLESLENDDSFLDRYREQRTEQLAQHFREARQNAASGDYGQLHTLEDEGALLALSTRTARVVIHFYLETFPRCQTMDSKLRKLAAKHMHTRFVRISVEKCPFLVQRLGIKVLPCVISYRDGLERDRLVGFQDLGNQPEDFPLAALERRLASIGMLPSGADALTVNRIDRDHDY